VGSAEQYALTVTIDLRTNTVLVGGTEHYVSLASEIIETLDSHPAQERKAKVYRLRNSRAADMETALRTFLQQDLNRTISILGQSGAGAAQTILDREVSIVAETVSNSLLISSSPRYFTEVEALIEELDQPLPQVLIQVVLAEVTLDSKTELGVEWKYMDAAGGTPFSLGTDLGVADALEKFGGFSAAVTGSKVNFLMRALQEDGRLEVLSSPQILTADNVEANINIGERVPIVTDTRFSDYGNQTSTYEYENVGVILTVTPSISPDGTVKMTVEPEVSQLTSDTVEVSKDVKIPIISQRTARTTVSVQSGQSVLIGGLISTTDDSRSKKVPWIGNIPLLGALFRNKAYEVDRKELLIVLTPQVIMSSSQTGTNIMDVMDMTRKGFQDSILQTGMKRDPLQEKVLKGILPEGLEMNEDAEGSDKKTKRSVNHTKELLIDP
jgi:type II secretion system protein D